MSNIIEWVIEMDVQDGQGDAVAPLLDEMVKATRVHEPGAMHYHYYRSADGAQVTVVEAYENNAAAMTHLANFNEKFAERFFAAFAPTRFRVYGPAEDDLRTALAPVGAVHLDHMIGFTR